ncbi:DNA ligase 1-like [Centruroides sculpturatus]|uniref:DNA ligase 1-like n=1 Tax=Centruroides sculpturatus TaxID=218467 RepID=UPI000C6E1DDD|nr:DNA ligase 1-like [Centruroides sculpturatus]
MPYRKQFTGSPWQQGGPPFGMNQMSGGMGGSGFGFGGGGGGPMGMGSMDNQFAMAQNMMNNFGRNQGYGGGFASGMGPMGMNMNYGMGNMSRNMKDRGNRQNNFRNQRKRPMHRSLMGNSRNKRQNYDVSVVQRNRIRKRSRNNKMGRNNYGRQGRNTSTPRRRSKSDNQRNREEGEEDKGTDSVECELYNPAEPTDDFSEYEYEDGDEVDEEQEGDDDQEVEEDKDKEKENEKEQQEENVEKNESQEEEASKQSEEGKNDDKEEKKPEDEGKKEENDKENTKNSIQVTIQQGTKGRSVSQDKKQVSTHHFVLDFIRACRCCSTLTEKGFHEETHLLSKARTRSTSTSKKCQKMEIPESYQQIMIDGEAKQFLLYDSEQELLPGRMVLFKMCQCIRKAKHILTTVLKSKMDFGQEHVCKIICSTAEKFRIHMNGRGHKMKMETLLVLQRERAQALEARMKASHHMRMIDIRDSSKGGTGKGKKNQNWCTVCECPFVGNFLSHRRTKEHRRKRDKKYPKCRPCRMGFSNPEEYKDHCTTEEHKKKASQFHSFRSQDSDDDFLIVDATGIFESEDKKRQHEEKVALAISEQLKDLLEEEKIEEVVSEPLKDLLEEEKIEEVVSEPVEESDKNSDSKKSEKSDEKEQNESVTSDDKAEKTEKQESENISQDQEEQHSSEEQDTGLAETEEQDKAVDETKESTEIINNEKTEMTEEECLRDDDIDKIDDVDITAEESKEIEEELSMETEEKILEIEEKSEDTSKVTEKEETETEAAEKETVGVTTRRGRATRGRNKRKS